MYVKKYLTLLGALATLGSALNDYEIAEFEAMLVDVNAHLEQYISLAENNPDFTIPAGVLECYTQVTTYTDDSYTTLFTMIDFAQVTTAMELLPWYSSRIEPIMSSYFKAHSITETADPAAATGSPSQARSSISVIVSSSGVSSSSKAPTSQAVSSSKSSSSKVSSTFSTVPTSSTSSAVSSAASSASSTSSTGAANMLTAGLGAVIAGAAALLL